MTGPSTTPRRSPPRAHARLAASALLLATGAAGCLDIADPVEPEPGPGSFQASVALRDGEPPVVELTAAFDPGVDVDGEVRSPAEPALEFLGTTAEPSGGEGRTLRYRSIDTLDAAGPERATLEMKGPRLSAERPRTGLSVPLIWRDGPRSVEPPDGGDLELPLRGTGATEDEDLRLSWRLEVTGSGEPGFLFTSSGRAVIPDTLEVPAEVLETAGTGNTLRADLRIQVTIRAPPEETGYQTLLRVSVRLEWRVAPP